MSDYASSLPPYNYRGARACVILHETHLREFIAVWKAAKSSGQVKLPQTGDPSYTSFDHLVQHVLRASRGYIVWCCEKLGLPDPGIPPTPEPEEIEPLVDEYLAVLLNKWRSPLAEVPESRFDEVYKSRWKVDYCIDAILEHAVMHPIRHAFQLRELMGER